MTQPPPTRPLRCRYCAIDISYCNLTLPCYTSQGSSKPSNTYKYPADAQGRSERRKKQRRLPAQKDLCTSYPARRERQKAKQRRKSTIPESVVLVNPPLRKVVGWDGDSHLLNLRLRPRIFTNFSYLVQLRQRRCGKEFCLRSTLPNTNVEAVKRQSIAVRSWRHQQVFMAGFPSTVLCGPTCSISFASSHGVDLTTHLAQRSATRGPKRHVLDIAGASAVGSKQSSDIIESRTWDRAIQIFGELYCTKRMHPIAQPRKLCTTTQ